jgi:hypothetical protein
MVSSVANFEKTNSVEICIVPIEVYEICFERVFHFLSRYIHQNVVRTMQICMIRNL